jgi:hypothetical protein
MKDGRKKGRTVERKKEKLNTVKTAVWIFLPFFYV